MPGIKRQMVLPGTSFGHTIFRLLGFAVLLWMLAWFHPAALRAIEQCSPIQGGRWLLSVQLLQSVVSAVLVGMVIGLCLAGLFKDLAWLFSLIMVAYLVWRRWDAVVSPIIEYVRVHNNHWSPRLIVQAFDLFALSLLLPYWAKRFGR